MTESQLVVKDDGTNNPKRFFVESGHPVEWVKEENHKFALVKFRQQLQDWLQNEKGPIYPSSRSKYVLNMLNDDFEDLSVSRLTSKVLIFSISISI